MKKRRFHIPFRYLLPVVLLLCALIGGAVAKYVTTETLDGTVTFNATLAESVVVQEHTVTHNDDGRYTLSSDLAESGIEYKQLIPGLDIPKDPHVVITGKTSIPAYLFIELVDGTHATLSFNLTDNWKKVTGATPDHGGTVYVYTVSGTEAKITTDLTVGIIKDNKVYASQTLVHNASAGDLTIYAKLVEAQGDNLAELYNGAA